MRAHTLDGEAAGMKIWIALALTALLLVPATASAGTITGKLPRKGKPMTVRVVRADTGEVVLAKRLAKPRYRVKVGAGPHLVFGTAANRRSRSRMVRVGKRGTRPVAMRAAAPVAAIVSVDPQIEITGMQGYPNGLAIDTALITEMFAAQCANGSDVKFVETRDRAAIEREIKLQQGKGFDPKTRVKPNFTKPDTFISGHGEVSGGIVTINLTMTGRATGSSSVTVPVSEVFGTFATLGSDLMGQICNPQEDPAPPPPVVQPRSGYAGSLSGTAVIPGPAGTTTETWSAGDVRFTRTPGSSDSAPGYQITAGSLQFSVSGDVGACTFEGSKAIPLAVAAGDAESTLDLAPDDSYFAVGHVTPTLDVTYTCPDGSTTMPYGSITEFLRTNPGFERRQPGADGSIAGSASSSKDGKALSWTWAFSPR